MKTAKKQGCRSLEGLRMKQGNESKAREEEAREQKEQRD